eukprot:scaffold1332_cov197-Alexandrium_tamarense.AAC.27
MACVVVAFNSLCQGKSALLIAQQGAIITSSQSSRPGLSIFCCNSEEILTRYSSIDLTARCNCKGENERDEELPNHLFYN